MTEHESGNPWEEKQVPIQDVVISNSWALQAILLYLEEQNPGARDRVWQLYAALQQEAESQQPSPDAPDDPEEETPSSN